MPYRMDIPGFMDERDLQKIEEIASQVPDNGIVVEVGSWLGMSTWAWAKSVKPSVTVYAIDLWEWMPQEYPAHCPGNPDLKGDPFEQFKEHTQGLSNIVPLKRESSGGDWSYGPADVVFVDAMHQNPFVHDDLVYWEKHIKRPGGLMCGDDYADAFPAVQQESRALAERNGAELQLPATRLWIVQL